jgi:predicted RNA binding protein YcfA (HicA-like mRNA interferase family)
MPSEVAFRDVRRKLEEHGWTLDRISGSHHVFRKEGERPISIPVH